MSPDKEKELIDTFPELFSGLDSGQPIAVFGFECGDGWFDLLKECIEKIKIECDRAAYNVKVSQVKEKYGSLRFYLSETTDVLDKIIDEAEKRSETTCENCGNEGTFRKLSWVQVLCDNCLQIVEDRYNKINQQAQ